MILCIKRRDDSRCNRRTSLDRKCAGSKAPDSSVIRKEVSVACWPVGVFLVINPSVCSVNLIAVAARLFAA